jgi:hypothetical protein
MAYSIQPQHKAAAAGAAHVSRHSKDARAQSSSSVRIMLFHTDIETVTFDMTGDDETPVCTSAKLDRPDAATALLRQYTKAVSLQEVQLQLQHIGKFSGISSMLLLVPQLRVLDLSECPHESADLLIVARHLQHLQQLLLHCPKFTTLAGCRKSSGDASWARMGGCTSYEPSHVAALAQLPQLRHLECPVPTGDLLSSVTMADGSDAHPWACDCEWLQEIALQQMYS